MATSTVQVGRLTLREDRVIPETMDNQGIRSMSLKGQESPPRLTAARIRAQREDILGLAGAFVPVSFTRQSSLNAFYVVSDTGGEIEEGEDGLPVFRWTINMRRVGTPSEIDLESRLSGAQTRANSFTVTGERSHAPALGATGYWAGAVAPGSVLRPCADGGSIRVYRAIGTTVNPRWVATPANYGTGRCRLLDGNGWERTGTEFSLAGTASWEIQNGVVRVRPNATTGTFDIAAWDGTQWETISWLVQMDNPWATVEDFDYLSVLRNEFDCVIIRLIKSFNPGRIFVDLTLRRGARVLEVYTQNEFSTRLRVIRMTAAASTQTSGYVLANAADAAGNKSIAASALAFTANTVEGGVEKTATTTLDTMVGVVLNSAAPLAGDAAAELYAQYLGMPGERVGGVQR